MWASEYQWSDVLIGLFRFLASPRRPDWACQRRIKIPSTSSSGLVGAAVRLRPPPRIPSTCCARHRYPSNRIGCRSSSKSSWIIVSTDRYRRPLPLHGATIRLLSRITSSSRRSAAVGEVKITRTRFRWRIKRPGRMNGIPWSPIAVPPQLPTAIRACMR